MHQKSPIIFIKNRKKEVTLKRHRIFSVSDQIKMFQCRFNAVFIHRCGHIIGKSLYFRSGIAHGHADGGILKHLGIVLSIAESHDLFFCNAKMIEIFSDPADFTAVFGNDIHSAVAPAGNAASRGTVPAKPAILLFPIESRGLEDRRVFGVGDKDRRKCKSVGRDLCQFPERFGPDGNHQRRRTVYPRTLLAFASL